MKATDFEIMGMLAKDIRPKGKTAKRVESREASCKCLLCDSAPAKRGLCPKHYGRYYMALQRTTESRRASYERGRILDGTLLPDRQGQRIKRGEE